MNLRSLGFLIKTIYIVHSPQVGGILFGTCAGSLLQLKQSECTDAVVLRNARHPGAPEVWGGGGGCPPYLEATGAAGAAGAAPCSC